MANTKNTDSKSKKDDATKDPKTTSPKPKPRPRPKAKERHLAFGDWHPIQSPELMALLEGKIKPKNNPGTFNFDAARKENQTIKVRRRDLATDAIFGDVTVKCKKGDYVLLDNTGGKVCVSSSLMGQMLAKV